MLGGSAAMEDEMEIQISEVCGADLHLQYPGQHRPQSCFVELDCRNGRLSAEANGEIGNAVPVDVHLGHIQRWTIPALRSKAANELLEEIAPLAAKVVRGYYSVWNGNNHAANFKLPAQKAIEAIEALCHGVDPDEALVVWAAADWFAVDGNLESQAKALGITAATTDEELDAIAKRVLSAAKSDDVDEIDGLDEHLRRVRDAAARLEDEDL